MLVSDAPEIFNQAYRAAIMASKSDLARGLQDSLSRRLTAYIAGVKDAKSVTRWISGDVSEIREDNERRLRTAYEIVQLLSRYDSPEVARAWFIGLNPQLDDMTPAEAIREGKLREALTAARAFVVGG